MGYSAMDKGTGSSIPPFMLLQVMHIAFPRFAEKSPHGGYQQQDANECWTRKPGTNQWIQLDDDKVSPISEEDVLKLSGGGDWHCAYVLLYGPRLLELDSAAE